MLAYAAVTACATAQSEVDRLAGRTLQQAAASAAAGDIAGESLA